MTEQEHVETEGRERLTVQIVGGGGDPERLLHLFRGAGEDGRLLVREWSSAAWDAPREYEIDPEDLYRSLQGAQRQGRRLSEDLYRVRRWLDGADV